MVPACPVGSERGLTPGEVALVRSVFGEAVDCERVRIHRRRWFPLQPRNTVMAPCGHIHFHPASVHFREDFSSADIALRGLFIHEMTHVWQSQARGRWYLPLMRHPLCRYDYTLVAGRPFERYGIEQQAEIVRHVYLLRSGLDAPGSAPIARYEGLLPFHPG